VGNEFARPMLAEILIIGRRGRASRTPDGGSLPCAVGQRRRPDRSDASKTKERRPYDRRSNMTEFVSGCMATEWHRSTVLTSGNDRLILKNLMATTGCAKSST